jgi:hypothetical protein
MAFHARISLIHSRAAHHAAGSSRSNEAAFSALITARVRPIIENSEAPERDPLRRTQKYLVFAAAAHETRFTTMKNSYTRGSAGNYRAYLGGAPDWKRRAICAIHQR